MGVALVSGGNLGMPVMVEIRTRQTRHGGAGVDITAQTKPVPRIKPGPEYATEEEIEELKKREQEAREKNRSKRAVVWGATAKAEEKDIAQDPGPKNTGKQPEEDPLPRLPETDPQDDSPIKQEPGPDRSTGQTDRPERPGQDQAPLNGVPAPQERKETIEPPPASLLKEEKRRPEKSPLKDPLDQTGGGPTRFLEPRDVRIHRVANRVGYVTTGRPNETLDLLRRAAARTNVPPSKYTEVFARIGRTHCSLERPQCESCPLNAKCVYKKKLDAKQAQDRGVLGRFFHRRH